MGTYLKEEIQQEALVQNLGSFHRFLKIVALMNGQPVNVAGISRDAGIARTTVQRYFDTLVDTLVGFWLLAWQPRIKVREAGKAKFYFFNPGVVRVLANRIRDPLGDLEKGHLLETYLIHEFRAYLNACNVGGELCYWRTPAGVEVDLIWSRGDRHVGFEIKSSKTWRVEYGKALNELLDRGVLSKGYGLYMVDKPLKQGGITVLPIVEFVKKLWKKEVFS